MQKKLGKKQTKQLEKLEERAEKKKKKKIQKLKEMRRHKRDGKELVKGVGDLEFEKDEMMKEVGESEGKEGSTKGSAFEGFRE